MVRSVLANWAGLLVAGVTSFVLLPIFIHWLGDFYFGMWALISALVGYSGLLDMGMRTTVQRFVARSKGRNNHQESNRTLTNATAITLAISCCATLSCAALTTVLPDFFALRGPARSLFQWLLILLGLEVAVSLPARLFSTYLIGLQRFDLYNLLLTIGTTLRAAFQVAVLRAGWGVLGLAGVNLAMEVAFVPICWKLLRRTDPHVAIDWKYFRFADVREIGNFGFYAFLANLGDYLRFHAGSLIIGRVLSVSLVTPFAVASRLMSYFRQVTVGLTSPLMPKMSALEGLSRLSELRHLYLRGTRISTLLSFFVASLVVLDGRMLLHVWVGETLMTVSFPVLVCLSVGYTAAMAQWPSSMVLYSLGRHRPLGLWTLAEGCINVLLSIMLGSKYGLWGVALGTAIPMLFVACLVQPWYVLRLLRIRLLDYVRTAFFRPAIAAFLFLGTASFLSLEQGRGDFFHLFQRVFAQIVLYAGLLWTVGLDAADRRFIRLRLIGVTSDAPKKEPQEIVLH